MPSARVNKKIRTLQKDDNGDGIIRDFYLRTYSTGKRMYFFRSHIEKPELANNQKRIDGSLRTMMKQLR